MVALDKGRSRAAVLGVVALACTVGLSACGGSGDSGGSAGSGGSGESGTTVMKVGVTPVGDFAPLYYAKDKGIFAKNGLDVTIDPKGASEVPPLISGSYQAVSMAWATFIQATAQGVPLRAIFPGINGAADTQTGIYVMPSSGISSVKDLEGKNVAINQPKANFELNSRVALQEAGVDVNKVQFQVLPLATMADALVAGKVDAAYLVPPFSTQAEDKKAKLLLDPYAGRLAGSPIAGYVMSEAFVKQNPKAVAAFKASMTEAAEQLNADKSYRDFVTTYTKLTPELAQKVPAYEFPAAIDVEKLQSVADLMADAGFATKKVDISQLLVDDQ